jgi:hypothetical protein
MNLPIARPRDDKQQQRRQSHQQRTDKYHHERTDNPSASISTHYVINEPNPTNSSGMTDGTNSHTTNTDNNECATMNTDNNEYGRRRTGQHQPECQRGQAIACANNQQGQHRRAPSPAQHR